jgi:predicted aspartyl protease
MAELDGPWQVVALANFDPPSAMATVKAVMALIPGRARRRPPSAPTTTELARDVAVPAKLVGHRFAVEAKIDGKGPFRFTVDTGTTRKP